MNERQEKQLGNQRTKAWIQWIVGVVLMGAGGAVFALGGFFLVILGLVLMIFASLTMSLDFGTRALMILCGLIVAGGIAMAGCALIFRF